MMSSVPSSGLKECKLLNLTGLYFSWTQWNDRLCMAKLDVVVSAPALRWMEDIPLAFQSHSFTLPPQPVLFRRERQ